MDQNICIKFYVGNKIKCSEVLKMLITAFGKSTLSQNMFISRTSSSQKIEKMLMTKPDKNFEAVEKK